MDGVYHYIPTCFSMLPVLPVYLAWVSLCRLAWARSRMLFPGIPKMFSGVHVLRGYDELLDACVHDYCCQIFCLKIVRS